MIELTTEQWVLGLIGAFLVGLTKGGVPGVGNLSAGIYAVIFASKASVGILLPVLISADVIAIIVYRKHAVWGTVFKLIPWTLLGLALGWFFLGNINDRQIQIFIGILLISMSLVQWFRNRLQSDEESRKKIQRSRLFAGGIGVVAGFSTMVANAAGPVASLYLIAMGLPKYAFIGTGAWFFFIINLVKVPLMASRDILHWESLSVSFSLAPAAVLGALIAPRIVKWIKQDVFEGLIWLFIIVAGIGLLVKPNWPSLLFQYAF